MSNNTLLITDQGLAEAANASAGGYLIDIVTFKVGTGSVAPASTDTDLLEPLLTSSNIVNIQVAQDAVAIEFTLYLPAEIPGVTNHLTINEVGLFFPSGDMFARGVFVPAISKPLSVGIQIVAVIAASANCDLTTINVAISGTTSLPSVPYLRNLIDPSKSLNNVIAVLDQSPSALSDPTAGLAIRYGAGADRWSFLGYNLVYEGYVDLVGLIADPTTFKLSALTASLEAAGNSLVNHEKFIVQVVSGSGNGQTRRVQYSTENQTFTEMENTPLSPALVPVSQSSINASKVCLWRSIEAGSGSTPVSPWPTPPYDHPDYVLTVGDSTGARPRWLPIPQDGGSAPSDSGSTLYQPPSRLVFKTHSWTSDGINLSYKLPAFSSTSSTSKPPPDIRYTFVSVQGVLQTRQSYEIIRRQYRVPPSTQILFESVIVFSEVPPLGSEIELWYAYDVVPEITPGAPLPPGYKTICQTFSLGSNLVQEGDRKFYLRDPTTGLAATRIPDDVDSLFVSIGGIKQFNSTFLYTPNGSPSAFIEFNEAPPPGVPIEVTTVYQQQMTGAYSTTIINNDFFSYDNPIVDVELSVIPPSNTTGESVNSYVFVNVSGIYIHRSRYTVVGNRILFNSVIAKRRPISVTIFHTRIAAGSATTNLTGVVTDALMSADSLHLLRNNDFPVRVPLPRPNLIPSKGITITGTYPDLVIGLESVTGKSTQRNPSRFSNLYSQEDSEEVIYLYKLAYAVSTLVVVTVDFSARLGPGFMTFTGREYIEYSVGLRSGAGREPAYGRRIKGTGEAGFSWLGKEAEYAYANASITETYEFMVDSTTAGSSVDVVARMRVLNTVVSEVHSYLSVNFNVVCHTISV